jgi:hypothetical protein
MHSLHRSIRGPDRGEMLLHLGIWSAPRLVVRVGPLRVDFCPLSDGRFPANSCQCDTKSLVEVVPTSTEGTIRVTG